VAQTVGNDPPGDRGSAVSPIAPLSLADRAGEKYEQARAHEGLAATYAASGAEAEAKARRHWHEALTRYTEVGAPQVEQVRAKLGASQSRAELAQAQL
jgi:hypothetical protein